MLSVFLQVIRRDLLLAMRQKSDVLNTLFFFVVVVTMVPLGIGLFIKARYDETAGHLQPHMSQISSEAPPQTDKMYSGRTSGLVWSSRRIATCAKNLTLM